MEIKLPRAAVVEKTYTDPGKFAIWFRRNRDAIMAWSFLTPMIIYFCIMTFVPMAFLIVMSFTSWNLISPPHFNGLTNLQRIFSSYQNWFYLKVIGRTVLYGVCILSLNVVGGFFVALVLNQHLRQSAVSVLGYGLAAESQSHDTAEYRAVPEQFRARKK